MSRVPYGKYTKEFREEAVQLVIESELSVSETARRLSLPKSTLENWIKKYKNGDLGKIRNSRQPLSDVEQELVRVKRELAQTKMERDLLKKAAAYFAKESLWNTL
jgi:transposase